MPDFPDHCRQVGPQLSPRQIQYSICTLVTKPAEYGECVDSFVAHGFGIDDCEYLFADNSTLNVLDGYSGYNAFLSEARGAFIILVHQDVELLKDGRTELDARLQELTQRDPDWAACGNAGTTELGDMSIRITDPNGTFDVQPFPASVLGLDENFVVVRRAANLTVSPMLRGFHLYATELCTTAAYLGMKSYTIDFHLRHKSAGSFDADYLAARNAFRRFRANAARPRIVGGTSGVSMVSGSRTLNYLFNRVLAREHKSGMRARLRAAAFRWLASRRESP